MADLIAGKYTRSQLDERYPGGWYVGHTKRILQDGTVKEYQIICKKRHKKKDDARRGAPAKEVSLGRVRAKLSKLSAEELRELNDRLDAIPGPPPRRQYNKKTPKE